MTIFMVSAVAVAAVFIIVIAQLISATGARGRAQAAADLAAIAGAQVATTSAEDPCLVAREVASRNRAALTDCRVADGGFVTVSTTVSVRGIPGIAAPARARARAGPVGQ